MEKRKFICEYCKKEFEPQYPISSNRVLKYCCKSCKTKHQIEKQNNYKFYNKETLEFAILNLIRNKERYLTRIEITQYINVSSKTLNKFKISITELNKIEGFKKPKSKFEESVYSCICEIYDFIEINREVKFDDCLSPKNEYLYFDFYIKNKNIMIEADGKQHSDSSNPWYSEYYVQCDNIKNNYCKDNNIKLIRIPYVRKVDIEYIKSFL